jgi:hypothetical protein
MRKNQKVKIRGTHKRAARNEGRPRIGQVRVNTRPMPHKVFCHAWLPNGTQVAIARSNDRYICGHFDAYENPLSNAAIFEGGDAKDRALTWLDRQKSVNV